MCIIKMIQVKTNFKGNFGCTICKHTFCGFCILSKWVWEFKAENKVSVPPALSKNCVSVSYTKLHYVRVMYKERITIRVTHIQLIIWG